MPRRRNRRGRKRQKPIQRTFANSMVNQEDNVTLIRNGGKPPTRGRRAVKFFDTNLTTVTPSTSGVVIPVFQPPQGVLVTDRIGDVCYLRSMCINYTCNAANADVFSSLRVVVFQWKPNANLLAPTAASIFQFASDNVNSMYDWNFADQYIILYDKLHSFAGTAAIPTASTNQNWVGEIPLRRAIKKVNFAASAVGGSNQIYLLIVSDSSVIPFPNFTFKTRVMFEDEL